MSGYPRDPPPPNSPAQTPLGCLTVGALEGGGGSGKGGSTPPPPQTFFSPTHGEVAPGSIRNLPPPPHPPTLCPVAQLVTMWRGFGP